MQVICIIHWTNPGSNMQMEIMECWLELRFACTIDSVKVEPDLQWHHASKGFKFSGFGQFMQQDFEEDSRFAK